MTTVIRPDDRLALPPVEGLSVTTHVGLSELLALEAEWRMLVVRSGTQNGFMAWEWVAEWARTFMRGASVTFVARSNGRAVAIAPFVIQTERLAPGLHSNYLQLFGPRSYQHLFEVPEVLAEPACASQSLAALVDHALNAGNWDWLEISASGEGIKALDSATAGLHVQSIAESHGLTPVMALQPRWDLIQRRLRRNVKESIRRAYNSFKREGIRFTFRQLTGEEACDPHLQDFFALHRDRARYRHAVRHADYFRSSALEAFGQRALGAMLAGGQSKLAIVQVDGRTVASRLLFEMGRTVYLYLSGFDTSLWATNVPTLLVAEVIKDAANRGMESINFSPGVDQSKSRWDVVYVPSVRQCVFNGKAGIKSKLRAALLERHIRDRARSLLRSAGAPPIHMVWNRSSAGW